MEDEDEDEASDDVAAAAEPANELLDECDQAGEAIGTPDASSPPFTAPATAAGASLVRPNLRFLTTGRRGALLGPSGMGSGLYGLYFVVAGELGDETTPDSAEMELNWRRSKGATARILAAELCESIL